MRILFLSHYFPPEVNAPASRTFEHCKEWVRAGHRVTVVTCAPNHPRGVVYEGYRNRLWQREEREGIEIVRLWTYVTANEGFLKRTLSYVSFMLACMFAAPFLPRADVLITTSPQFFNGLAGYPVRLLKRIPWVLEIRDLWPESILTVGAIKNKFIIRCLSALESFAYRQADHIVPVTESFRRYMLDKGLPARKITVIRNGVDLKFFVGGADAHAETQALRAKLGLEGKFVASYVGTHGMAHKLETVLEAAEKVRHRPEIVFLLVGDGAERRKLMQLREARGLTNVILLEQQPKEMMPQLWAISDVSLVLLKKSPLFTTVIPSKIFESMAMRKPLVLGVEGETKEIVEAAQAGIAIEPENAAELAAAVVRLFEDPARARELGGNGRRYVAAHFDRTVLAQRFLSVLSVLTERQGELSVSPDRL